MIYHIKVFILVVHCCLFGSFACAYRRPIRVVDESAVTVPESEPGVEPAHESETDQQQGKHLLNHSCSYMNS